MVYSSGKAAFLFLLSTLLSIAIAASFEGYTDQQANGALADLLTVKINYYRALCMANSLSWDQGLSDKAKERVEDCDLEYDYWSPEGQIIFRMVGEGNRIVNSPNATTFAVEHWYDMRHNYTNIKSDDYDELQPFVPAWEFTEMVWKANTKFGCWYAIAAYCPDVDESPNDKMYQLYCLFTPGGNKWDQWGANVVCPDCKNVQPQTSIINTATLSFPEKKRAVSTASTTGRFSSTTDLYPSDHAEKVEKAFEQALSRVKGYTAMDNEEFLSRWDLPEVTPLPGSTVSVLD